MPIFVFMNLAFFNTLWAYFHGKPKRKIPLQKMFLRPRKTIYDKLVALASLIFIILLQECASFYFWSPTDAFRMQGSGSFCSLVASFHDLVHLAFANLWQSCHNPALLSTFFGLFFVRSTSKCSAFTEPLFSSILSTSLFTSSHITFKTFSKIFHVDLVLDVTASWAPPFIPSTSPR